jgi:acetyltransferase-like isoleucine patch superfamily enzyme
MNYLAIVIIILIAVKYLVILIGYVACFFAARYMRLAQASRTPMETRLTDSGAAEENYRNEKLTPENPASIVASMIRRTMNGWMTYSLAFTGRIPSHLIRNFIFRHIYGVQLGRKCIIYGGAEMRAPYNIRIGEGSIIGNDSKLDGRNGIVIGSNVNFSTGVWIWTEQHDPQCPYFSCTDKGGPVIIGDRAWVSCRAVILPRVTIGEGAVIAAGAVVTRDVEPYAIYAGVPAKKIGARNRNLVYELDAPPLPFY